MILPGTKGLQLRDELTGKLQRTLAHPTQYVADFAASPDGTQLWASYNNGQIWSWRVR